MEGDQRKSMDAVTLLNQNIDMKKLLEHYDFDKIKPEGSMIRSCCRLHGGDNEYAFVVNQESGLWYCHTGDCGGGDAYNLIQKIEGVSFTESVKILANILGIDIDNLEVMERKPKYQEEIRKWLKTMQKIQKKKTICEFTIPEPIKEVTKYRNFNYETLQHFKLGYVENVDLFSKDGKKYTLRNRLVFPVIFDGVQIGMSFRRVKAADYPKWSHQPPNFVSGNFLYNFDSVKDKCTIAIVEGFLDVWAYHEIGIPAVATFGAHITDEQYKLLMRTGADLVFSFDGDDAGNSAKEKAIKMFRYKANMQVVNFHENEDPESIQREELKKRYDERERVF